MDYIPGTSPPYKPAAHTPIYCCVVCFLIDILGACLTVTYFCVVKYLNAYFVLGSHVHILHHLVGLQELLSLK